MWIPGRGISFWNNYIDFGNVIRSEGTAGFKCDNTEAIITHHISTFASTQ